MSLKQIEQKNRSRNFKYFGLEKASPTFQKIITKYQNKRKDIQEKPKTIMAFVEKARFQAENMETEDEYMMKELRNDRKFTQQLIFLYGQRAEKHYNELNSHKEYKSKLNKNYFFTPSEIQKLKAKNNNNKNKASSLPYLTDFIFDKKKSIFSSDKLIKTTSTFNKEKKSYNSSKNSTGMLGFYNTTANIKTLNNNIKKKNDIKNLSSKFNTENNMILVDKKKENLLDLNTKQGALRDKILNLNLSNRKNTFYKNKTKEEFYLNKMMYMDKLVKINNDFLKTKNEFRKHFEVNDYGCTNSKLEYEYLTKKFFN